MLYIKVTNQPKRLKHLIYFNFVFNVKTLFFDIFKLFYSQTTFNYLLILFIFIDVCLVINKNNESKIVILIFLIYQIFVYFLPAIIYLYHIINYSKEKFSFELKKSNKKVSMEITNKHGALMGYVILKLEPNIQTSHLINFYIEPVVKNNHISSISIGNIVTCLKKKNINKIEVILDNIKDVQLFEYLGFNQCLIDYKKLIPCFCLQYRF